MNRRAFIVLVGGVAVSPPAVFAQSVTKSPLVAVLSRYSPFPIDALKEGLRERGRVDGQSIQMQVRSADGDTARLPELAHELVGLKPDVLVAGNDQVAMTFKKLTTTIPIVGAQLIDPIGLGMIESLARPAGNVTGMLFTLEGMPEGVSEHRIHWGQGYRIYFAMGGIDLVVLLGGSSSKKDQQKDIATRGWPLARPTMAPTRAAPRKSW